MASLSPSTQLVIYAASGLRREAWRALLSGQPGIAVLGDAGDIDGAAGLLRQDPPLAVLVDDAAPQPEIARRLKAAAPEAGVLFLVPSFDVAEVVLLLQAGATGCISLEDTSGDLARAIIAVGRGEIVLPAAIASGALAALARGRVSGPSGPSSVEGLIESPSDREAEVLRLLAQGLTNKDIAQTLIISVRTVEAHLRSVYGKLGVRSRTEAVLWAVKHGYGPEV